MIIKLGDSYPHIVDVMNQCFGWHYKACMKGYYDLNEGKTVAAWFPKLAISEKGKLTPGDKWYGCLNVMTPDGECIYESNDQEPGWLDLRDDYCPVKTVTFVKEPNGKKYSFAGVYVTYKDKEKQCCVHKRIATEFDTDSIQDPLKR